MTLWTGLFIRAVKCDILTAFWSKVEQWTVFDMDKHVEKRHNMSPLSSDDLMFKDLFLNVLPTPVLCSALCIAVTCLCQCLRLVGHVYTNVSYSSVQSLWLGHCITLKLLNLLKTPNLNPPWRTVKKWSQKGPSYHIRICPLISLSSQTKVPHHL